MFMFIYVYIKHVYIVKVYGSIDLNCVQMINM